MNRIHTHERLDRNLYCFHDLNDSELGYCYENAKMLLFPSIAEGFGLPIVEGLMHRLPVMASDIPIHREVGRDHIGYFDLDAPADLEAKIRDIETQGIPEALVPADDYRWLSWSDSIEMLLVRMLQTP